MLLTDLRRATPMARQSSRSLRLVLLALALCASTWAGTAAATTPCGGDCNGDGRVTVDEIVLAINIALGRTPLSSCPAADANNDNTLSIDELTGAVGHALNDCTSVAGPGTHALLDNPGDPAFAVYKTLDGDAVLYSGDKDGNGVPTVLRSVAITAPSGDLKATVHYAYGDGYPTSVQAADGTEVDLDWSPDAALRLQVHLPDGSTYDYAIPFAHAGAAGGGPGGAAAGFPPVSQSHESVITVTRCGGPVENASVEVVVTPTDPGFFSEGTQYIATVPNVEGPGKYGAFFAANPAPPPGSWLADLCPGANQAVDGAVLTARAITTMGAATFCALILEEAGPAAYDRCNAAVEALEVPARAGEMNPEGNDFFNCEYLQQLIDQARNEPRIVQPRVHFWGSSQVFSAQPVTVTSLTQVPDFSITLPNAVNGGQIVVLGGPGADYTLGATDAGAAVKCAPSNTLLSIRWHHSVQLGDQFRNCSVSGNGNCDSYFGPISNCCELCPAPGGCPAAICPGDFFSESWPGGSFYLDASTLFAVTGALVYPGCF
jgi:hypothetical protein